MFKTVTAVTVSHSATFMDWENMGLYGGVVYDIKVVPSKTNVLFAGTNAGAV